MDYFCDQVQQKDVGRRMQVGQEFLEYLNDPDVSSDIEQDQQRLDKVIDELTGWVNSSNYKVRLMPVYVCGGGGGRHSMFWLWPWVVFLWCLPFHRSRKKACLNTEGFCFFLKNVCIACNIYF